MRRGDSDQCRANIIGGPDRYKNNVITAQKQLLQEACEGAGDEADDGDEDINTP